jgi:hypothetical protein
MPATPTITWVDSANGTGGVLTITGSTGGSTNTVYSQAPGGTTWTSRGSRVGDGTITLSLTAGYYHLHVSSSSGGIAVSNIIIMAPVSSDDEAVHERCVDAVVSLARTLATAGSLPLITDSTTQVHDSIDLDPSIFTNIPLPALVAAPKGVATHGGVVNERDDIGYPVPLIIVDRNGAEMDEHRDDYLLLRERLDRYFRNQPLTGVPEIINCIVDDTQVFEYPKEWEYQWMISTVMLRFISREARGI